MLGEVCGQADSSTPASVEQNENDMMPLNWTLLANIDHSPIVGC